MISVDSQKIQEGREKQHLLNGEIHNWYRFIFAYPDHLVTTLFERFDAKGDEFLLDPFCGTGTTLVEGMKLGMNCVGIEANPVCTLASRVKTNWNLPTSSLLDALDRIISLTRPLSDILNGQLDGDSTKQLDALKARLVEDSSEGRYFVSSKMLERGWISEIPFYKVLLILNQIKTLNVKNEIRDALLLALVAILVEDVANIKFGPELYVTGENCEVDVLGLFELKVRKMAQELNIVNSNSGKGTALIVQGDARNCETLLRNNGVNHINMVITSPPYPAEKDYTRQTRLELVFLGYVYDRISLQAVKKAMLRSNTKGIYISDNDGDLVKDIPEITNITKELREKMAGKTDGFSQLYPKVTEEYFGGMYRHLQSLFRILSPGGKCAYVVGDQRTYLQTFIPTGKILEILARKIGYDVETNLIWRVRKGTSGSRKEIEELILMFRKPTKTS